MMTTQQPRNFAAAVTQQPQGVLIRLKVVPGASRTRIMGMLGDCLKVAVAAPPEAGKANKALLALLAKRLDVAPSALGVTAGRSRARKTVTVIGIKAPQVLQRLNDT